MTRVSECLSLVCRSDDLPTLTLQALFRTSLRLDFQDINKQSLHVLETRFMTNLLDITEDRMPSAIEMFDFGKELGIKTLCVRALYEFTRTPEIGNLFKQRSQENRLLLYKARLLVLRTWTLECVNSVPGCVAGTTRWFPSPVCRGNQEGNQDWLIDVMESPLFQRGTKDPIVAATTLSEIDWQAKDVGYCDACLDGRREHWENVKNVIWDKLKVLVGIL